jgi:hypothetical protein
MIAGIRLGVQITFGAARKGLQTVGIWLECSDAPLQSGAGAIGTGTARLACQMET